MTAPVIVSVPGRICLFGDHQDYLGLPIITAALSVGLKLTAWRHGPPGFRFRLTNPESRLSVPFDGVPLLYEHSRDYLRACANVLLREGFTFSQGIEGSFQGELSADLGGASAMILDWIGVLSQLADQPKQLESKALVELAHAAEVREFGESASMANQYAMALGGVLCLTTSPTLSVQPLPVALGSFVVAETPDSVPEVNSLASPVTRNRLIMNDVLERVGQMNPAFSLHTATVTEATEYKDQLGKDEYLLLKATLASRDLTADALSLFHSPHLNHARLGQLLTQHHTYLRDACHYSSARVDRLLDVALRAGALGGKINTSGGGGSLFVYAPDNARSVAEAIERAGGKATVVRVA
ncbi:galactokinase family protein [Fibrella rubiginis]|uniref:galactokinase family protein n=1 Tax=Fibrella rubiginis TaxID=2817060 RepID=UPI001E51629E|nr:galactokinase family protein [Fibrella rubiginis]